MERVKLLSKTLFSPACSSGANVKCVALFVGYISLFFGVFVAISSFVERKDRKDKWYTIAFTIFCLTSMWCIFGIHSNSREFLVPQCVSMSIIFIVCLLNLIFIPIAMFASPKSSIGRCISSWLELEQCPKESAIQTTTTALIKQWLIFAIFTVLDAYAIYILYSLYAALEDASDVAIFPHFV